MSAKKLAGGGATSQRQPRQRFENDGHELAERAHDGRSTSTCEDSRCERAKSLPFLVGPEDQRMRSEGVTDLQDSVGENLNLRHRTKQSSVEREASSDSVSSFRLRPFG